MTAPSYDTAEPMGFFTDTSVCIGCKACEVACKQWNDVPADGLDFLATSYDNTGELSADTWRHVAFIEKPHPEGGLRWLMSSDVCKHCVSAACLDVCPTGALFRTEFSTVVVQQDICNGCGYCVSACPFGVIDQRKPDGRVWKCTLCYDRLRNDMVPACAQACPTESIRFGPLDELRAEAAVRRDQLVGSGVTGARLYGADPSPESSGGGVGGFGAFFLLLDAPEVYGLPPAPVTTTRDLPAMWRNATTVAMGMAVAAIGIFASAAAVAGRSQQRPQRRGGRR